MARPVKNGVDYFPLDTVLDTKFELIEAEFGLTGFAVIVKLFQKIYGGQGYYCEWTDEVALLFSHKCGGGKAVSEIVSAAVKRGIFDKDMYDKYSILTSKGIQERYFEAVNRRAHVEVEGAYLLICVADLPENVNINGVNVYINPENVCRNTQSKVNKTKLNKIILNNSKSKEKTDNQPTAENNSIDMCLKAYEKYIGLVTPNVAEGLEFYLTQGMESAMIVRVIEYVAEQSGSKRSWQYLKAALMGNLKAGILTLDKYNLKKAEFVASKAGQAPGTKKSKINNYTDTNVIDYAELEDRLMSTFDEKEVQQ